MGARGFQGIFYTSLCCVIRCFVVRGGGGLNGAKGVKVSPAHRATTQRGGIISITHAERANFCR